MNKNKIKFIIDKILSILFLKKFIFYEYSFLEILKNKKLLTYIENVAKELAKKEDIPIFNVNFDEINKNEVCEAYKAVGRFVYLTSENILKYNEIIEYYKKNNEIVNYNFKYPRIELTEKADVFVLLHELGHYFIYKNDEIQSEEKANEYIFEFFKEHLPEFFSWIYQINIEVRTKKITKYSEYKSYVYYLEYKKWLKENNL